MIHSRFERMIGHNGHERMAIPIKLFGQQWGILDNDRKVDPVK